MQTLIESTLHQFKKQNQYLMELSQVLNHLIKDRSLCNTNITQELFLDYIGKVKTHIDAEEKVLYSSLLLHEQSKVKNTALMFLAGSQEVNRIFSRYSKRWCKNPELRLKKHARFVAETEEMFELIHRRIQSEKEKLYPLIERNTKRKTKEEYQYYQNPTSTQSPTPVKSVAYS